MRAKWKLSKADFVTFILMELQKTLYLQGFLIVYQFPTSRTRDDWKPPIWRAKTRSEVLSFMAGTKQQQQKQQKQQKQQQQ